MSKRIIITFLLTLTIWLSGCQQSSRDFSYNHKTGDMKWHSEGDISVADVNATVNGNTLSIGSSKSENLAYREGFQAAKEIVLKALNAATIGGGK